jgi:phage N-6-adenine-methyltransferase
MSANRPDEDTHALAITETALLALEHLAATLERACNVSEIADVRDRARALQTYARAKSGGERAAAAAGAVVVRASALLARLYQLEPARAAGRASNGIGHTCDVNPGKAAVASAIGLHREELRRLRPLADAAPADLERAISACTASGEGVSPSNVVRALTATSAAANYDGDSWATPPEIIERVRGVFGGAIDLDPASNEHAQRTVKAARFYTKADDGLSQPWAGNVFCNPPYSMPAIAAFIDKLLTEKPAAAILLVNNCTDSKWFHDALRACDCVCFVRGRLAFVDGAEQKFNTRQGQALFYYGPDSAKFRASFSQIGAVLRLVPRDEASA